MSQAIPLADWLDHMDREYLSTFIGDGGGAVKFAVTPEEGRQTLAEEFRSRCEKRKYLFVELDAITSRVYMPQDIFFGLASQIDWRSLARRVILRLVSEQNYRVDNIDPDGAINVIEAIARANGLEPQSILFRLRQAVEQSITNSAGMARAFRMAMTHFCFFEENSAAGAEEYAGQPLLDRITGANHRIGNVRPFGIHTPVNRTTARYFIESALCWVRRAGYSGTAILLDNTRVMLSRNPRDGRRYYTRPMTIDHYELLRELIDDTDRLPGLLLVVLTDPVFVDQLAPRGWEIYPALRTRVMDDVRDRNVANPVAALARLS